ncbi:peptide-methionine (S)-S-oxide reductase [Maricaulis sp. W15]|uniref:Peptide methionine sulfoxide reductase MsrA n=1 Tax=Maricaulis maris TaxID=74318 RepID=A0A495D3B6_9PROT|nr:MULTISPECIES: peptide-methionine (S)-S-oxide reductase MsrA [Maricaulis]OLF70992.1 peptide-methionine (S)-S-oxide reductase [Maricaulis sp. W15]RKQ96259.1 peptide-methionine (S)-S-oxide reductase [Maricaulis maris]
MSDPVWKSRIIPADQALAGRSEAIATAPTHFITGRDIKVAVPDGLQEIFLGLGCFWGAERLFWEAPGVWHTAVGYGGGSTPNPTYEETCSGATGHAELVRVIFDPAVITLDGVLKIFWESHDPTQGMRQGNDRGTQYRSAIYATTSDQLALARQSAARYQTGLDKADLGAITTEITAAGPFYYAEDYHQQYLAKNPSGYCGIGGTGVVCPINPGAGA